MYYVYILRSVADTRHTYVGTTQNLRARLAQHNSGKSIHTNKFKPWTVQFYAAFPHRNLAANFERYLKTGSGRAFAARHLLA